MDHKQEGHLKEKYRLYDELAGECELQNPSEIVFGLGGFMDMLMKR